MRGPEGRATTSRFVVVASLRFASHATLRNGSMTEPKRYLALTEIYRVPPKGGHVVWLHNVCRLLGGARLITGKLPGQGEGLMVDGVDVRCIHLSRWPFVRPESLPLYVNLYRKGLAHLKEHRPAAILSARVLPEGLVANALSRRVGGLGRGRVAV